MRVTLLLCALSLFAPLLPQSSVTGVDPKAEKTTEESAPKPAKEKSEFTDFEKQLQKELSGSPERDAQQADKPSVFWQFVRTLLTLAILLAIFYGIFRLYKFKRDLPQQAMTALTSLYEYPLGPRQRIQIIEMAGKLLVLGVSENSIQLISEVSDKYTIDRIKLDCATDSQKPPVDFLTELSRNIKTNITDKLRKKKSVPFDEDVSEESPQNFEAQRQHSLDRLRKLKSDKFDWREKP